MSRRAVFIVDAALLVLYLLLLAPRLTGLAWHEWMGLAVAAPILMHVLASWRWVRTTAVRLLADATPRARINAALNAALFVMMVIEITSGVAISRVAVPRLGVATVDDRMWRALHNLTLNWLLLVVGLHLAMNWAWVAATLEGGAQRLRATPDVVRRSGTRTLAGRTGAVLLAAAIVILVLVALLGLPTLHRRYPGDDVARFGTLSGRGVVQITGEAFLLAAVAYVGRRWLRIRL